jgi:hypothetical protein
MKGGIKVKYYSLEVLKRIYQSESPTLTESEITVKAKKLHSVLNTMDMQWKRSNRRFYLMNDLLL